MPQSVSTGVRVLAHHQVVVRVGVTVAVVVEEEREPRQVDVVAGEDDLLARRGVDDLRFDPTLTEFDHATAGFALVAAERPRCLILIGVRVGEKLELAVGDLLHEHRGQRVRLHDSGQLIDPLLLFDPDQQSRSLHVVDEVAQALLRHDLFPYSNAGAASPVSA